MSHNISYSLPMPFLIVEMLVLFLLLFFPSLSIEPMKFLMK